MPADSLKAQDLIVALKLVILPSAVFTYAKVSAELGLPASGVHASVRMLIHARLATGNSRDSVQVNRTALHELIIYGVPYFFLAQTYDTSVSNELLAPHGIQCPRFPDYAANLLDFVEDNPML